MLLVSERVPGEGGRGNGPGSSCIHDALLSGRVRRLLNGFHSRKQERGVDEMLLRLYEPILWRALKVSEPRAQPRVSKESIEREREGRKGRKGRETRHSPASYAPSAQVANPIVRANAASLLVDAFPLQDSNAPRAETDAYVFGSLVCCS